MTFLQAHIFLLSTTALAALIGLISTRITANLYRQMTKKDKDALSLVGAILPVSVSLMFWAVALMDDYRYEDIGVGMTYMALLGTASALVTGLSVSVTVIVVSILKALYEGICASIDRMFAKSN